MKVLLRFVFLFIGFAPLFALAEGSKNLTPNKSNAALTNPDNDKVGYLAHDANFPSATGVSITSLGFLKPHNFSRNGATFSPDHRLYVRVKDGERLYYGVRRAIHDQTTANQADLVITIRRAGFPGDQVGQIIQQTTLNRLTNSTRQMLLNTNQAGVIGTVAQVDAGPRFSINNTTYNSGGYTPLGFTNATGADQDYWVEFTQVGEESWTDDGRRFSIYDLWDFTVVDGNTGAERPGRLYSKLWSFSAGATGNVFSRNFDMYPLIPSETQPGRYFVKILELAGIAPQYFFRFVTNSMGTTVGSTFEERRKSQTANSDYPEYDNFVNNPDPAIWPTASAPTFNVDVQAYCSNSVTGRGGVTFTANSSESSTFIVLIDMNNNGTYEPGTADVLLEKTGPAGTKVITWDGLNGLGQVVAKGTTLRYYFKNGSGPVNFPVWDAETNLDGFRVGDVRPAPAGTPTQNYNSKLYWDDSKLATSRFPAPQTQLFGIAATGDYQNLSGGQHKWGANNATAGDLYTVNTWTYGYTNETTFTHTYTFDCNVDLVVTNTASGGNYIIGKPFTYTVTIVNNGPQLASGIVLRDLLNSTNLNFISATASHGTYNSTTGEWTVPDMGSGATRTLTITASPKVTGTISQTATITGLQQNDSNTANNSATATINVVPAADIEIRNVASGATFNNGDEVTYTVTARNLGPNNATGVTVNDLLPAGLTFVSATTSNGSYNATSGVWTIGALNNGATATLTLKAIVARIGSITTTASLGSRSGFELDENTSNNTSSNTINVNPTADVEVTSSVSNPNPSQGDVVRITVRAKNNGPNEATNLLVTNTIPGSFTVTRVTGTTGTYNASNYTWNIGSIPVGTTHTINFDAIVNSTGQYTIVSTQSHTEPDGVSSNNSASSTITVSAAADVAVTNTISPVKAEYANGDQVTYTVTVTNNGPSSATNVVVTDKLPASLTYNTHTVTTGNYNPATGAWTVGTLANGATATLTLTATINQSAVITTTASQTHTETDNVAGNNTASNTIRSGSGTVTADIKVDVLVQAGTKYTGDEIVLTVKVNNTGPDAATALSLDAVLVPTGMTLVSHVAGLGTYNAATGKWTIGNLASGADTELKLTVRPEPDTTVPGDKTYTFKAENLSLTEGQGANINPDTDQETIVVKKKADAITTIAVTGDINGVFYNRLTEATFTITVTNAGPDIITNLVGTDTRTGFVTFTAVPVPSSGTTYSTADGNWRIPVLYPGETKTLIVKGVPNRPGRLNLGGQATYQDQYDPITENNIAIALLNVLPVSDLNITHTVSPGPYYNGQNVTYTVTLLNQGPDAATGVTIEDQLPEGLTFVSAVASMGTYNPATGIWTLGSDVLPSEAQTLVIAANPSVAGSLAMTARVKTAAEFDNDATDNQAIATIQTAKAADIRVLYNVPAGEKNIGIETTFAIEVTNLGPDDATNILIQETLPAGLSYRNAVPTIGTYNVQTGIWTIPALANNEKAVLQLTVVPTKTGAITNYVYKISSDEYDPNGQNNQEGNNRTTVLLTISDRAATYTANPVKNFYDYRKSDVLAFPTDPDGSITTATLVNNSSPPAGLQLENNGRITVTDPFLLRPGSYFVSIALSDEYGNTTTITNYSLTINGDRDGDGVADLVDIDDNNDGIPDTEASGGYDPYGDADGDGIFNYVDVNFMYNGNAFRDINGDGINDWFDLDLDGIINSLDIDIDNDGIPNAIEANGGAAPIAMGYSATQGILTGGVSANGMIIAAQTGTNNGLSRYAMTDTDRDGIKDLYDLDSDNDGLPDIMEAQTTAAYTARRSTDTDRDGLDDAFDPSCGCALAGVAGPFVDTDGDGKPDYIDTDSDDDLKSDMIESFDDNLDGGSSDDLKRRAANFTNGFYPLEDLNFNKTLDWLDDDDFDGILNFQTPGHKYYYDTNGNGIVDLFDPATNGIPVQMQLNANNKMNFRDATVISPLPVTLISFTARLQQDGVQLNWATASELNNDRFEVERSQDGKYFTTIATVKGAGTSNTRRSYSLLDVQLPLGVAYYRLKQVDTDGTFEYSKIVAVQDKKPTDTSLVTVYPNPATDAVNLDLRQLPAENYVITIVAMDGRVVKQMKLQGGQLHQVTISYLAVGKYIIRVQGLTIVESHGLLKK